MEELNAKRSSVDITVRGYYLDMYGQVNNARFMELLEEARWHHFSGAFESGVFAELDLALVLVNIQVDYRRPAFLGDTLQVQTMVERIGNTSLTLSQNIVLANTQEPVLQGKLTYVLKDLKKVFTLPGESYTPGESTLWFKIHGFLSMRRGSAHPSQLALFWAFEGYSPCRVNPTPRVNPPFGSKSMDFCRCAAAARIHP